MRGIDYAMPGNMISGTRVPNTPEGVTAYRQAVIEQERRRVQRNQQRSNGNYAHDLDAASAVLDQVDATVNIDWLGTGDATDTPVADLVTAAREAIANARVNGFNTVEVVTHLADAMNAIALVSRDLANRAIGLDTVIKHLQGGEPES